MEKPTQHSLTWTVDDTMTAKRIGAAGAKILSTPNMLALMEACALGQRCPRRIWTRALPPWARRPTSAIWPPPPWGCR